MTAVLRAARPDDYDAIASVVDEWWGRPVVGALPRLFLHHFHDTSLIAERDGALMGFLIGFHSAAQPDQAYIHFAGVSPHERGSGLARRLYEQFFAVAARDGRTCVSAITSPVNETSIKFHRAMGFSLSEPVPDYDGPGVTRVVFTRTLE